MPLIPGLLINPSILEGDFQPHSSEKMSCDVNHHSQDRILLLDDTQQRILSDNTCLSWEIWGLMETRDKLKTNEYMTKIVSIPLASKSMHKETPWLLL